MHLRLLTVGILGAFRETLGNVTGVNRSCWPKVQCDSVGAAEAQMRSILKRNLAKNVNRIHVYFCVECSRLRLKPTWHVGHQGRGKKGR